MGDEADSANSQFLKFTSQEWCMVYTRMYEKLRINKLIYVKSVRASSRGDCRG